MLRTIVEEELPARAEAQGTRLLEGLQQPLAPHHQAAGGPVGDIRGRGMAIGVEMVNPISGQADGDIALAVARRAYELGCVVYVVGGNVLEITPPLILDAQQVDRAVETLAAAVDDVGRAARQ